MLRENNIGTHRRKEYKMSNDSYGFFQSGAPSLKFLQLGTSHTGTICEDPYVQQQTDPKDGTPKTWPNGDPMLQLVIPMKTAYRDAEVEDDDGERRLFVANKGMREAVQKAVSSAGAKGLDIGGQLTVTWTSEGEKTNPAFSAPKLYQAHYVPPQGGDSGQFLGTSSAPSTSAPAAAPAPAQPAAQPVGTNGAAAPAPAQPAAPVVSTQGMPAGMTPEVWQSLSPEARQALANITA
jgi:hypothetical protein